MQTDTPMTQQEDDNGSAMGPGAGTVAIAAAAIAAGGLLIWWGTRAIRDRAFVVEELQEEGFSERYVMEDLWSNQVR